MLVREERADETIAVRALNARAFETPAEARLVDALRRSARPFVSLVADDAGIVIGHIAFSPVEPAVGRGGSLMGLAPMAVEPARQREGIGSALVHAGLAECARIGAVAVVVLGHPAYYPRFGFRSASRFGIRSTYDVPDEAFMALELVPGALVTIRGTVRYHPAFDDL